MRKGFIKLTAVLITYLCLSASVFSQTTEFTYQGSLQNASAPANGNFDFEFALFDSLTGGMQQGATLSRNSVAVSTGAFAVKLDFGSQFSGANRYLEIRVRPAGQAGITILAPRQIVNSAPYAVKSLTADNAANATNSATAATATNATQLGGIAASQYVVTGDSRLSDPRPPTVGSSNYIQNQTASAQAASFFLIGNGTVTTGNGNAISGASTNGHGLSGVTTSSNISFAGVFGRYGLGSGFTNVYSSGVWGDSNGGTGVVGTSNITNGVLGSSSTGAGVLGASTSGIGVSGNTGNNGSTGVYGIQGAGSGLGGFSSGGVYGGVLGDSSGARGVTGLSNTSTGVYGRSLSGSGVYGQSDTGQAGTFQGKVYVSQSLGVGSSSPTAKLTVVASTTNSGENTATFIADAIGPNQSHIHYGTRGDWYIRSAASTGIVVLQDSGGRVGIGTAAPAQTLSVNGDAGKSIGGGSWAVFSDERLKNIERRFTPGLAAVMRLQPVYYKYRPDNALGLKAEGDQIGFSAQAVEKVIPEAVTKNEQGYRMVNNDPIMWAMLNAIKEQQAQIETQAAQIARQNAITKRHEAEIRALTSLVCLHNRRAAVCKQRN